MRNQPNVMHTMALWMLMCLLGISIGKAQSYAGDGATAEPLMLVDKPTAGMLKRGSYEVASNFFQQGGVLVGLSVGVFEQFMFGISYGGTDIIGHEQIRMNPAPGVSVKLRLFNESSLMPAIALGFDSQGKEPFLSADSLQRYTIKAPGAFISASKNYALLGNLSLHGGLNFTTERNDGDKDMNAYVGIEKSIGKDISLLAEYDLAFNDDQVIGKGKGYLNLAFRWSWGKGLVVGFDLKNIIKNQDNVTIGNRTLQIDYIGTF
ncbi:MAG: hypothetical protein HY966_03630 [Ignavibacteriales bacterium]|nr:hypothetical protein [Ignavibacteriales bacterium]